MNILVTGTTGFIGSHIMSYLNSKGYDVYGCVRSQEKKMNNKYVVCDLENETLNFDMDIDVVIHTAAIYPFDYLKFNDFFSSNVMATRNVLRCAKMKKIKRIIYMGSVVSYGQVIGVLREDSPHNNPNHYGLTKYVAEKLIRDSGIPYYILILPGVVGKGCRNNWIMNTAQKLYRNEDITYYNGKGLFNNILEVQDLCRYVEQLLEETTESETYLLGSNEKIRVEEVLGFLKDRLSSNSRLLCDECGRNTFYLDISKAVSNGFYSKPIKDILEAVCEETLIREEKSGIN